MNIYLAHCRSFDFKKNLYEPIKNSQVAVEHKFLFPFEEDGEVDLLSLIEQADVLIADVGYSSTELGIELGWASRLKKPILAVYKTRKKFSPLLKRISSTFIEYTDSESLVRNLIINLRKYS